MEQEKNQLSALIAEIKIVRRSYAEKLEKLPKWGDAFPPSSVIVERFFLSEIQEIIVLLTLINAASMRHFERQALIKKANVFEVPGLYKKLNTLHGNVLPDEYIWPEEELRIFIKTLYEWIFHLSELFKKNPKTFSNKFPNSGKLKEKLTAYCDFRSALITHKSSNAADLWGGYVLSSESGDIVLWILPMKPSEEAEAKLEKLFKECSQQLGLEPPINNYFYNRCWILSQHRHELKDTTRTELGSFIKKNGSVSQTTVQIAEFIKEILSYMVSNFDSK